MIPFCQNERFFGREAILDALSKALDPARLPKRQSKFALYGFGGCGKTQIALEYVYRHYDQYETILQIDQLDREQMFAELPADLAQFLAAPILQDADGNYLIASEKNMELVETGHKPDYSYHGNRTWFECDENKVNLRDFGIAEEYSNNLEYQSELSLVSYFLISCQG